MLRPNGFLYMLLILTAFMFSGCIDSAEPGHLVPRTTADDPTLPRFVLEDGTILHLETFGDSNDPTVIILHGGPGGDYHSYRGFASLADTYHVVLWDQRGTGLSERVGDDKLTGPQYLADLNELGETFSPDGPFYVVGHSWGGAYATYYAQQYPERVADLVLIEPGALNADAAEVGNVADINFFDVSLNQFLNATDYLIPNSDERGDYLFVIALTSFDDGVVDEGIRRIGFRANLEINDWQGNWDGSHTFDATTGLEAFEGRTLLITGETDGRLGHTFQVKYHAPYLPNVEVWQLAGADHSALVVRDEVFERVRLFLDGGAL